MTSTCVYCDRDVRAERTEHGVLVWRAIRDSKLTCDMHPYDTDPMVHAIMYPR